MKPPTKQLDRVDVARRQVEARLADVQTAVKREVAWLPSGKGWLLPMIGLAFGIRLTRRAKTAPQPAASQTAASQPAAPQTAAPQKSEKPAKANTANSK